ncbi:MAG: CapA family protein [Chloroflexota bacterium]
MKRRLCFLAVCWTAITLALVSCAASASPTADHWPTMTAFAATNQALWRSPATSTPLPTPATLRVDETSAVPETPTQMATRQETGVQAADAPSLPTPTAVATVALPDDGVRPEAFAVPGYLPPAFRQAIVLPEGVALAEDGQASLTLRLDISPAWSRWVYVLVAPFPTLTDNVSAEALRQAWSGSGRVSGQPLLMDAVTKDLFSAWWGAPAGGVVEVVPAEELSQAAWERRTSWAVIPFEDLEPSWKVLSLDGQSPIRNQFDSQAYPLAVSFGLLDAQGQALAQLPEGWSLPETNRNPQKLTVVAMTGVTALVRGTSNLMYAYGTTYPAEDIGPLLRAADITHISNEIAFADDCPFYDLNVVELVFCTHPKYIGLLEEVGTDVVEMTGDHFIDQPAEAIRQTLERYHERGWLTYGGGLNLEDGLKALTFEHNGNKVAFIGCNGKGKGYALASDTAPGAAACDYEKQYAEVRRLASEGYLVIATIQHEEVYQYKVLPAIRPDFVGFADAGAAIVQGSQAHQPQNFEFYGNGLVHYGLGNLFFDQLYEVDITGQPIADKAFIDLHTFYAGRYISTELVTIQFIDLARSRLMTPEERVAFLEVIFKASGW